MSIEDMLKSAMLQMLKADGYKAATVVRYEDDTEYGGYCETCSYEYAVVRIYYDGTDGIRKTYTYRGDFGDLISTLDSFSDKAA